jgi:uncharacterized membrane protein YeaQ/YmgE (transglycosylase-associated protein family)
MYAVDPAPAQDLADEMVRMTQLAGVALLAGWVAERTLDTGVRLRGLALLAGAAGFWAGSAMWDIGGWDAGPTVWGYAILPALAGAFAVCGVLKLVSLGVAGPRW